MTQPNIGDPVPLSSFTYKDLTEVKNVKKIDYIVWIDGASGGHRASSPVSLNNGEVTITPANDPNWPSGAKVNRVQVWPCHSADGMITELGKITAQAPGTGYLHGQVTFTHYWDDTHHAPNAYVEETA